MRPASKSTLVFVAALILLIAAQLGAVVPPEGTGVREKTFRHPDLQISTGLRSVGQLPPQAAAQAAADLAALGVPADRGQLDVRGGRWGVITPSQPLVPGRGVGNELSWDGGPPADAAVFGQRAAAALRSYLQANRAQLRIDVGQLAQSGNVTVLRDGELVQFHLPRVVAGVPVRDTYLTASMVQGNLVLFGAHNWGDIDVSTTPSISAEDGLAVVQTHLEPDALADAWGKTELILVPTAKGRDVSQVQLGQGYAYRLAWVIRPSVAEDEIARYEGLVDAHTGELISFEDTAHYASTREVVGGVLPETNDGVGPEGTEQAGWPMPFVNVDNAGSTFTTDEGGNLLKCVDGTISSQLEGPFMLMNDTCGAINESTTGDVLDFGTNLGTDCDVAPGASSGNTRSSRSGFYEMNRYKEMARGQLPTNPWLQAQLRANMNIDDNCNAGWNGEVNFFTSGGGCSNTGEIAGIFVHEVGHGMDANDATPGVSVPGEGIADIYASLRLGTSCIGHNFRPGQVCGGYGDPCLSCTGVRDIDYANRASGLPHTLAWIDSNCSFNPFGSNGPCGGSSHCEGAVYAEAVWDLWKRDLPTLYGMTNNTALEVVTRLTYIGAGNTGTWFSCSSGGCPATSGYMNYLTADDDNGNLNDGTPHMQAIFAAFDRHGIACATPTPQDSGCGGTPTAAPSVTGTAIDRGAELSWSPVSGATEYEVFRTDGVFACDFGKTKIATTTDLSFIDSGLQNGRDYYYTVIAKGPSDSCFGPASACTTVTPVAGANLGVDAASAAVAMTSGDGDDFIDNCETGTLSFDVLNIGTGSQTNVRIDAVRAVSHPSITIDGINAVSPSTLADCATGSGSFDFTAEGLSFGDTVVFEVDVTSDQLFPSVKTQTVSIGNAESDLQSVASRTYDFESDLEGWTVIQGTFFRASTGGGAGGSSWYARTSSNLNNQCDQIRSPAIRLTATSTMTVSTNFDIEDFDTQWWDRANVAFFEGGARNAVNPDSGRLYNASGAGASCVTAGQSGWAASSPSWAASGFSATALDSAGRAGQALQIDVAYGTDGAVVGDGFRFDQLTITDFELLVADAQSDICTVCGDGTCDANEDQCSCPADCGTPPNNETPNVDCSDGIDNDCDTNADCADADCATDPFCLNPCDNDGVCEAGEDCNNCSNDCISGTTSGASCGNGLCEAGDGEDCVTCPSDCNGIQNGKPSGRFCCGFGGSNPVGCGDSRCTTGGFSCTETPVPSGSYCCGDGTCEGPEDSNNCAIDCGAPTCPDGFCDPATEDQCSCAADCGAPPANEVPNSTCQDTIDNDCDGAVDCADLDCDGIDPACICLPKNASCTQGSECCSGVCKNNGRCR